MRRRAIETEVSPATLRRLLDYDRETGGLTWRPRTAAMCNGSAGEAHRWNGRYAGKRAFTYADKNGYRRGGIFGHIGLAHRVIWALVYGQWPDGQIDHINGDPLDNRLSNLRVVTPAMNSRNRCRTRHNKSGQVGVRFYEGEGKWRANIGVGRKRIHLGTFSNIEAAIRARRDAEQRYGFHPNHGRAGHVDQG